MIGLLKIKNAVENIYKGVSIDKTIGYTSYKTVDARKTYCKLSKELTRCSFQTIGEFIGINNHSLIFYYCKKAIDHIETDNEFNKKYNKLIKTCNEN